MTRRRLDWSFGPGHGPVSGVLNAAGAAVGATMVADLVDRYAAPVSPAWPLTAGAAAAAVSLIAARWTRQPDAVMLFRVFCWLGAGLWSTWTLSGVLWSPGTPWSVPSTAVIGIGALAAALTGLGFQSVERREENKQIAEAKAKAEQDKARLAAEQPATDAVEDRIAARWTQGIARVCSGMRVEIKNVELWPGDPHPGFTLDGECPPGGASWRNLQGHEEDLAADAKLPDGCSVKVAPGVHRGAFLMEVMVRNALAEERYYPREYPHESINQPRRIAELATTAPVLVNLRQEVVLVVGPTGSGKTTTMHELIAEHLKCVDDIVCVIDFNGGSLAIPWLLPWRADPDGCPREPIAWVADTPAKALAMTQGILDVIKDRKQTYAHVKVAANASLLPISADIPQFTIFVDEVAEILGQDALRDSTVSKVAANLLEIQRIGRDSGGRLVIASLGATNETLSSRAVKVHAKVKIAMGGTPDDELYYLFDVTNVSGEDAKWPGSAHIRLGLDVPFLAKFPHMLPEQIGEVALATSDRRPAPDARAMQVLGDRWTKRWAHSAELLATLDGAVELLRSGQSITDIMAAVAPERPEAGPQHPATTTTTITKTETPTMGEADDAPSLSDALADLEAAEQAMKAAEPVEAPRDDAGPVLDRQPGDPNDPLLPQLNALMNAPTVEPPRPGPAPKRPTVDPQRRMHQLVWDHRGRKGIGPTQVQRILSEEGHPTTLPTVNGWMKRDEAAGILRQPGGDRTPYLPGPKMSDPYTGQG